MNGFDFSDSERAIIGPGVQIDSSNAVEHDVGRSIWLLDAGAHESRSAPRQDGVIRLADTGADAEHAVTVQGVFEHLAIAFFEDKQGEKTPREEITIGQDHDRHLSREGDLILRVNGIHGRLENGLKSGVTVKIRIETQLG